VILYLTYWYPSHRRAKMIALFMSGIPVAGMFGNPLSGWIMDAFHNTHGWTGWQWMFLIEALPAFAIGIATILSARWHRPRPWLSPDEKRAQAQHRGRRARSAAAAATAASTCIRWAPCSATAASGGCLIYFAS
jgi:MFS family permease